jgi:(p)ppGpp synthase/HD superfamily hydrolase
MTDKKKLNSPHVVLGDRYAEAVRFASHIHSAHTRKGKDTAYVCHLLGVSALVLEAEGSEDQAIAGLLHDAAEDCGGEPMLDVISDKFGPEVARIVRACSDSLIVNADEKRPWKLRKEDHLAHLRKADSAVLIVTAADKLHNARAILTDVQIHGVVTLERFNGKADGTLWYYQQMLRVLQECHAPVILTVPLEGVVRDLDERIHSTDN